jgi:hypothetical protein
MAQWGRNDQAVTANSTTTKETSNGAPIGTYALVKGSGLTVSMVANSHFGNTSSGSRASVDAAMFSNVTPGAFINNMATGVFGVSATEQANNNLNSSPEHAAHAGWIYRKAGTGPIVRVGITAGGTGYNNTDVMTIASPQAGGNATVSIGTNSTGGVTTLTITNSGAGFLAVNATANISIANSTGGATAGSTGSFTATAGGRAGRSHSETLVAMGSLGANTTSSTGVVGAADTVADAASDNTLFPGR